MKKEERITEVLKIIQEQSLPISASSLAKILKVSRQIIVGDIALLRAQGIEIEATPKGYVLPNNQFQKTITSYHQVEDTRKELEIIISHDVEVRNVWIDHPFYNEINGVLNIKTQSDIEEFLSKDSTLLLSLTGGKHFHTLVSDSPDNLKKAIEDLKLNGFIPEVS